jgi:hypothetical protein
MIELMGKRPELTFVVGKDSIGWAASPDEREKLVEALRKAYSERKALDESALRARTIALDKYSVDALCANTGSYCPGDEGRSTNSTRKGSGNRCDGVRR